MENHPIPQDITGFKFKLIGKMTVRQFIYVAAGVIIAWIFYILPLPFIVRLPFIIIFASFGAALAFVPIDGRSMDTMIINFIKALFAPTQYVYEKQGGNLAEAQRVNQTQPQQAAQEETLPPAPAFDSFAPILQAQSFQTPAMPPDIFQFGQNTPPPPPLNLEQEEITAEQEIVENEIKTEAAEGELKEELEEAKKEELQTVPAQEPIAHQKTEELEKMLQQTIKQKDELEKELLALKSKLESQNQEKATLPVPAPTTPVAPTPNITQVTPAMLKEVDAPGLPQEPNLITGTVKDPRGNPIQNILVEVKDQEDNPVRAFKTNNLGKFASATSLSNGKYSVTFEDLDGKNKFDAVEIEATGAPLMPLDVISVDPREELRRELFN